ncbi:hypothetical protein ACFXHD_25335 [Streptomyces hydrogenans]|uniref:hypothetical protein n=1 Tax=Streptomyces hydrogenans TaxID=1873719 RepID=UPI00369717AA
MEATTPASAYYDRLRISLPVGSTPDAHDLDSPDIEAAFAQLAIDHPDAVTPALAQQATSTTGLRARAASRKRIADLLVRIVGHSVVEVRITPARVGRKTLMCVMLIGAQRREIPLPKGAAVKISRALRAALPKNTDWTVAQDYNTATGQLTRHVFTIPACLQGGAE